MTDRYRLLTRAALLLALTLIFQSLRLIIPLPPFVTTFVIGSLVNACLLIAIEKVGTTAAISIAVIAPVVAYFQQFLPLPVLILPVALANCLYVLLFKAGSRWRCWLGISLAAGGKAVFLYAAFTWLLGLININPKLASALMFAMSWPQLVTGALGGVLAATVARRLN